MHVFYPTFKDYVAAHPEGERYRTWLNRASFVQGDGPHGPLPGGYLYILIVPYPDSTYGVVVGDCDDGYTCRPCASREEAERAVEDLKLLSPFSISDLSEFGYTG